MVRCASIFSNFVSRICVFRNTNGVKSARAKDCFIFGAFDSVLFRTHYRSRVPIHFKLSFLDNIFRRQQDSIKDVDATGSMAGMMAEYAKIGAHATTVMWCARQREGVLDTHFVLSSLSVLYARPNINFYFVFRPARRVLHDQRTVRYFVV